MSGKAGWNERGRSMHAMIMIRKSITLSKKRKEEWFS